MEKEPSLVLVTWRDATTFYGWHSLTKAAELEPREIQTSGFLIQDTDMYLSLAASLGICEEEDHGGADAGDVFVIPRTWVMKVEKLGLAASCKCEVMDSRTEAAKYMPAGDAGGEYYPPMVEIIPGDEALGRQFTLDEHLRRGGDYQSWHDFGDGDIYPPVEKDEPIKRKEIEVEPTTAEKQLQNWKDAGFILNDEKYEVEEGA